MDARAVQLALVGAALAAALSTAQPDAVVLIAAHVDSELARKLVAEAQNAGLVVQLRQEAPFEASACNLAAPRLSFGRAVLRMEAGKDRIELVFRNDRGRIVCEYIPVSNEDAASALRVVE